MNDILLFVAAIAVLFIMATMLTPLVGMYISHGLMTAGIIYAAGTLLNVRHMTVLQIATFALAYSTWMRVGHLLYTPQKPTWVDKKRQQQEEHGQDS